MSDGKDPEGISEKEKGKFRREKEKIQERERKQSDERSSLV